MKQSLLRAALSGLALLAVACGQPPAAPSSTPMPAAMTQPALEPSMQLAIDPDPIRIGAPVMRNGARMYPVMWTMMVTERGGAPVMIDGWTCELRAHDGTVVFTGHFDGSQHEMHGHSMWKLMDQMAYVPDPARFGRGTLVIRLHGRSMSGRMMGVTATSSVW